MKPTSMHGIIIAISATITGALIGWWLGGRHINR